jgi:hypothetical protein
VRNIIVALVIALSLGGILVYLHGPAARDSGGVRVDPGDVNEPEGATTDPERWRAAFPLEPAPIHEGGDTPGARALTRALEPYRKGDYQKAASELEGVWIDYPDEHRAALFLGISRLFIDEVSAAIEVLRQAQASPDPQVVAEAQWYVLVGIARLREPASGIAEVREACERPGPYSARACAALEQLTAKP